MMDDGQLRFFTTQALYGKDLQERVLAIRQLTQGNLTEANTEAIDIRMELALGCKDEYVRSAAAMLMLGLVEKIPISPAIAKELLALSNSPQSFAREAALRAIKRICERGHCLAAGDTQSLHERLELAQHSESEEFIFSLLDEE